ncbi:MAG: thioredoxin domain-containing protein [Candidatus Micrarchaeota archaeon]
MTVVEVSGPEKLREMVASGKPLLVVFSADWCGDCKTLAPHFEKHAEALEKAGVTVARISLSKERETVGDRKQAVYPSPEHSALREEFAKHGFPTVVFFKDGRAFSSTLEDTEASLKKLVDYVVSRVKSEATCTGGCAVDRNMGDVRRYWKPRGTGEFGDRRVHHNSRFRGRQTQPI